MSDFAFAAGEKIDPRFGGAYVQRQDQVVLTPLTDGKFKTTSKSWHEGKLIYPDHEIRAVGGRLRIARK